MIFIKDFSNKWNEMEMEVNYIFVVDYTGLQGNETN